MPNPEPMPFQGKFEWTDELVKDFIIFMNSSGYTRTPVDEMLNDFKQSQMQKVLFISDDNEPVYDKTHIYTVYEMYDKVYFSEVIADEAEFKARGKVPEAKYFVNYINAKQYLEEKWTNIEPESRERYLGLCRAVFNKKKVYPEGILSVQHKDGSISYVIKDDYQNWCRCYLIPELGNKIWSVQNGDEVLVVGSEVTYYGSVNKITGFRINEYDALLRFNPELYVIFDKLGVDKIPNTNIRLHNEKTFTSKEIKEKISTAFRGFYSDDLYMKILKEFE